MIEKPDKGNIIDSKLILTKKMNAEGKIKTRKASLVARGSAQIQGVDYFNTFAPVVRLESLRILMALAVQFNLKINQIDVTSAYLNNELKENVFIKLPNFFLKY